MQNEFKYKGVTPIFGQEFCDIVIPLLEDAEREINIIIFSWRMPFITRKKAIRSFNDALVRAVGRGVKVRALVSIESVAAELGRFGIDAKVLPTSRLLHTKLLILDARRIILGSHNYSENAFTYNYEVSVFFEEWEENNRFMKYFENLWSY